MKKNNKKGFTLMEMLIVVAIIAILVAIAIPTMTNALEKSKVSADLANVRAWYADENVQYMLSDSGSTYTWPTAYDGPDLQAAGASVTCTAPTTSTSWQVAYSATYNTTSETWGGDALN